MAQIGHFDATTVAPREDMTPLQPGEYTAQITDSELNPTKAGNGHRLELTFEITDGPAKGRKVWANLNLDNPNPKAVEIAQRELSAICHAVGKLQVSDSQELHYKPMTIRVDIESSTGYADKNVIKAYKPLAGGVGNAPQSAPAAGPTTTSPSSPPWAQRAA
jgi:hypothetical protein